MKLLLVASPMQSGEGRRLNYRREMAALDASAPRTIMLVSRHTEEDMRFQRLSEIGGVDVEGDDQAVARRCGAQRAALPASSGASR